MLMCAEKFWTKPIWRTLALFLMLVFVSVTVALPIAAAAAEADIEAMKSSSVRVLITQGGRLMAKGSGFVIDDGKHIVTNYHVIEAVEKEGAQAWVVLGRGRPGALWVWAEDAVAQEPVA